MEWGSFPERGLWGLSIGIVTCLSGCGATSRAVPKGYDVPVAAVESNKPTADTTPIEFYFYVNADNDIMGVRPDGSIDNQGEMTVDDLKALAANSKASNFGMHIYLDRGNPLRDGDPWQSELFDFCAGQSPETHILGETDSSDPVNLEALLDRHCYFEAKRFVVLWSHGDGYRVQQDFDYSPDVKNFHISKLLAAIPNGFAEAVIFDSCSMASLEIASLLETKAKWMVSSQFELPNEGIQYDGLSAGLETSRDTLSILRGLRDASEKKFKEIDVQAPLVLVDLSKIEELRETFAQAWKDASSALSSDYASFRSSVLRGERDGDLYFLFDKYSAKSQDSLKAALESGRGSLHFALPRALTESDPDFEAVASVVPELFRTWSEKFPNWEFYSRIRPVPPANPNTTVPSKGETL